MQSLGGGYAFKGPRFHHNELQRYCRRLVGTFAAFCCFLFCLCTSAGRIGFLASPLYTEDLDYFYCRPLFALLQYNTVPVERSVICFGCDKQRSNTVLTEPERDRLFSVKLQLALGVNIIGV